MHQKLEFKCDLRVSFATAFKYWRRQNRVPLKQIAADLGLSVASINSWERGERFPRGQHFEMLVEYTGLPPCRFVCSRASECQRGGCLLPQG